MTKGVITRTYTPQDRELASQLDNILKGLGLFPFLGVIDADPTTTGWGAKDICWWANNSTATAVVVKFWNGSAVKTVTTS